MIDDRDKKRICEISKKYRAGKVWLFGSSLQADRVAADIDLAVEGIRPQDFFFYYGELMFALSKPVDLVSMEGDSRFQRLIRKEGAVLYG